MKKALCIFLAAAIFMLCVPNFVFAASLTASVTASEDAFTQESDPDSAVGNKNAATITTSSTGGKKPAAATRDVYLKFDVRAYDLSSLTKAGISLHITSVANKADRTLSVYAADSDWSEKDITWNNAPQNGELITTYYQKYDKNNNENLWINIDVTNYVKEHFDEGVLSFKITSDTGATKMDSKETANPPSLDVSFDADYDAADVLVKCVDSEGNLIARSVMMQNIKLGQFDYPNDILETVTYRGTEFVINREKSVTGINVSKGASNEIVLVYDDPMKNPEGVYKKVLTPTDDTFGKQSDASTVFNTEDPENLQVTMNLGASGAAARRDGFVKFDMTDTPYSFITSARLSGYVTSATNAGTRVIKIYPTESADWSEKDLTWNNAPAALDAEIAQISVDADTTGEWVTADITEYVRSAGGIVSLRMIADTAATSFATKDGDAFNAMALDVRYTTDENYSLTSVKVRYTDTEGRDIREPEVLTDCLAGDYYYTKTPDKIIDNENGVFIFDESLSTLHITALTDAENEIILVYRRRGENMGTSVLSESGAWSWSADPRAVRCVDENTGSDKTYAAYIDNLGNIKATEYDNIENTYRQIFITKGFEADDHAAPSIFVLPDKRIMILYAKHGEESGFYYRISEEANDISSLSEEVFVSDASFGGVTYPSAFYMESAPGVFYLFFRGINSAPTVAKFTIPNEAGEIELLGEARQIVTGREAKYASDGESRIFLSYTYENPDSVQTNTIYASFLDISDMTLRSLSGEVLANINEAPYSLSNSESGDEVVDRTESVKNRNWEIGLDENGNPAVLFVKISGDGKSHTYYRAKWTGEAWLETKIADGGGWFHDNTKGAEKCYSGGLCLDHENPNIIFASVPKEGIYGEKYEIYKYVLDESGEVVSETPVTQNSRYNNFRPYAALGANEGDSVYLLWLSGEYYYWSNKKDFLPSNGNVKYGFTTKVNTASRLTGYDPESDFESIDLGDTSHVVSDLAFVKESVNGGTVTWESSDTSVIKDDGALIRPEKVTTVTVKATITFSNLSFEREYSVTVYPKGDIEENLVFRYEFDPSDIYLDGEQRMVRDKSARGNDARLMGEAGEISEGSLDLTENMRDSSNGNRPKSTNSYLIAPDYLLKKLRSYTFTGRVKLSDTSLDYRLYDFGSGGTNSVFGRLCGDFQAGIKINDGTTQFVTADKKLEAGVWYDVAFTYDASSGVTSVYLDGALVASGKTIETEAIELLGENTRNYIGRSQWWDTYYDYTARENPDFNGLIDSVALYDTALSADEIMRLSNGGLYIDSLTKNGGAIEVKISNTSLYDEEAALFVRVSDDEGFFVKSLDFSLSAGESGDFKLDFGENLEGKRVRAFIWDKKTLAPKAPPAEIN